MVSLTSLFALSFRPGIATLRLNIGKTGVEALFWFGFIPIITIDAFPQFYVNCYHRKLRFQHFVFSLFLDMKLLSISL